MNIARMYTIALGAFGYTEDEARFLYIVATTFRASFKQEMENV